ncbi:23S rRNA (pseudouridine(1915)-N(3))-methyltransferase RlmH [Lachnoanaerobaculum sp. Marseille-Q4761]|uniref:23S rRNA (pseudouridine(1915)-N(3))-methyltransferase RlmH n=1 Tax=Lachnoanaerobaculum sp. Marseille-Q4761 TaxID=2819511 RepID=UPI001AA0EEE6|nr:23S rRNA (pseudouridine(1915)-N(3))-methyltransferase RlmH [Lachnoanaerobaculum sp. Marseille-Q4761]MBO1870849.1 23S rRNA (pseudouridine(1915)-N(3))-methyltransferase RlmH [Lachnoanaerobaculum sp. Marseille-Q4761]
MNINIVAVGSIKEKFFKDAVSEYAKRLSRYVKLNIIEVKDEKTPAMASALEEEKIKEVEAERILSKLTNSYVVALTIDGKKYSSEELAKRMEKYDILSKGNLSFIIGGSLGLHKSVIDRADEKLSFSEMTFPHQLMRVILLEQIYRAYRIRNNEPYHK